MYHSNWNSDYFFDRLVRHLPIPIPYDGNQLVSLTNVKDVARILVSPLHHIEKATQQRYFNCGTDHIVSYNDVAYMCADVAQIPRSNVTIEYFDPEVLGTKGSFPFRPNDFYVTPDTVKQILSWSGAHHHLSDDLSWYYNDYIQNRNGLHKSMSFRDDWEIVVGCKTSMPEYVESIYDQYDPLTLEVN
jgi:nucleoside-diphosphate-sugar epimerase